jgi:hypothetical protein
VLQVQYLKVLFQLARMEQIGSQLPVSRQNPYLAYQMSKWFYDTSTGAATVAARCGSFVGKAISLFGCSLWMNMVDTMIYAVQTV